MDLITLFGLDVALAKADRARARRVKSMQNMRTHRPFGKAQPKLYCLSRMCHFFELAPKCIDTQELLNGFCAEEMFRVNQTVIRNNRELLEFHALDSSCPRCCQTITSCACREMNTIETDRLQQEVHLTIRKLYMQNKLAIVSVDEMGICSTRSARDACAPPFFPVYGMGQGFSIYAEDFHLQRPSD